MLDAIAHNQSTQPQSKSMKYNPDKHHRRSIRLPGYDYSQPGAYFVTICAYQRQCLFGDVVNGQIILNQYGAIVADEWQKSSVIRQEIELDGWVVMPNHFHGIVIIKNIVGKNRDRIVKNGNVNVGANGRSPLRDNALVQMKSKSLSSLMAGFKSIATKKINILRDTPATPLWQRNYYEHIIRDRDAMDKIRQYIINNPVSWEIDQLHPDNPSKW
jgi:REP element-mobilizing transposase RayT